LVKVLYAERFRVGLAKGTRSVQKEVDIIETNDNTGRGSKRIKT
jgi:hypothetical protein